MLGNATILEIFNVSKVGKVAGCRVTDGKVERGAGVRLIRDNVVVHEGKLSQLKRFKDDVREVPPARNAAWPSRTTRTCGRATSSSAIGWRRCNARSEFEISGERDNSTNLSCPAQCGPSTSTSARTISKVSILASCPAHRGRMTLGETCMSTKITSRQHARRPRSASCASAN